MTSLPQWYRVGVLGRILSILGALAVLALTESAAIAAPPRATDLVKIELLAEQTAPAPGSTWWLDLHLAVAPGWHTYWRNPGDAGEPTTIDWTLPPGFSAGPIEWPIPERIAVDTITSYGYRGSTDLLIPVSVPATLADGASRLAADVKFLVCRDICIPGETIVALTLAGGAASPSDPTVAARFAAARARLPQPAPFATRFAVEAHDFRLIVPAPALAGLRDPTASFFPDDENVIANSPATVAPRGGELELVLAKSTSPAAAAPTTLSGVLVLRGADGEERGYQIGATPAPSSVATHLGWWQALVFAFAGGLILNLMPCVFPILSLKLLSLATSDPAARHHHGLAYTAGVLVSFSALGGALLALRAGGTAVGWGFQLQSPAVVALLAYLMLAMGLSLSGVAEFGVGFAGIGDRLAGRGGLLGAFFTGVLASVVASPCTAPFMAGALGAAVIAPAPVALLIFAALGAGLAAPMLLASFVPGVARVLPRPGAWMGVLKQVLAFPLYATVAWLVWVLIQEVAPAGEFAALLGLVLTGFAVWAYGRSRFAKPTSRRVGGGLAAAGLAVAVLLAVMLPRATADAVPSAIVSDGLPYQQFTAARLAALNAEHKPVFVNLTAAWCLTCLVNERATLDRAAVRAAFASHGIVALKGDWTRQDPEIASLLESFGRSGVPLYLLYDGSGSPTVLPQILTEAEVIEAVAKL
ncbi:MAG TPA: protein-disulfide reductase DsbD domain-containing protein [Stellaceae bacterium]|nr:protein-disulfide reductase DsbD domain-containing protein [Stellaceae bacterium]